MRRSSRGLAWAPVALVMTLAIPTSVRAQDPVPADWLARRTRQDTVRLSLADARYLAVRHNPDLRAERQEIGIAEGNLRQARTYAFNPSADLEVYESGRTGDSRAFTASLSQELQWAGQWGLRSGAARAGLIRARETVADASRLTTAAVSKAYIRALAAERRLALAGDIRKSNERLLEATRIQLREGEISTLEANLADIEFGRSLGRLLTARREATSALLELKRAIGMSLRQNVELTDSATPLAEIVEFDEDSLVVLAMSRRPDVIAADQRISEADLLRRLAGREAIPNLRLSALATRDNGEAGTRYGIGVGIPLPTWNRNRGLVQSRQAEQDQAVLRRQAVERRVRTEIYDALQAYRTATDEAAALKTGVLDPARRNLDLLETAYRAGKLSLPTLLLLRNQLLDAEVDYWRAWEVQRAAVIELQTAVAEPLDIATGADTSTGEN